MQIVNAKVLDLTGAPLRQGVTLRLEGERIASIGAASGKGDPDVLDAGGRVVMPGLINAHDHLTMKGLLLDRGGTHYYDIYRRPAEQQVLRSTTSALVSLGRGITTVRDGGAAWFASMRVRDAIAAGTLHGPRVVTCGQVLSVPFEGEGVKVAGMTIDAEGPAGVAERVRELVGLGVDFIKMKGHRRDFADLARTRLYSADEIAAAGREAHAHGRKFALHAWHCEVIASGLGARVADSIEHGNPLHERSDLIDRMVADGVIYVPNLLSWAPTRERDPRYKSMAGLPLERIWDSVEAAIAKGVTIAAGTDLHTDQLHTELEAYVGLGLPVEQALRTATVNGARLLGLEDRIGTVEVGKVADLAILDGDPREDLSFLAAPWAVVSRGVSFDGAQLRRLAA